MPRCSLATVFLRRLQYTKILLFDLQSCTLYLYKKECKTRILFLHRNQPRCTTIQLSSSQLALGRANREAATIANPDRTGAKHVQTSRHLHSRTAAKQSPPPWADAFAKVLSALLGPSLQTLSAPSSLSAKLLNSREIRLHPPLAVTRGLALLSLNNLRGKTSRKALAPKKLLD